MNLAPTTLEHDLFGDEPAPEPDTSTVALKEAHDLDDTPHQAMAGIVPVPSEPALNPAANDDDDNDDDDDEGLFGDEDTDDEMAAEPAAALAAAAAVPDDGLTEEERQRRQDLEYGEYDEYEGMEVQHEERVAQIELANFEIPKHGKVWHARLPNFIDIKSDAFDEHLWEPELDPDKRENAEDSQGSQGNSGEGTHTRSNVPDENVIRWRWNKNEEDGTLTRQSNARIVRWSDGSLSLEIGSELFDVATAVDHSALLASADQSSSDIKPKVLTSTVGLSSFDATQAHGLTYITAQHAYTDLTEAQASVHGTLTFRPSTLQSKTHKRLAGSIAGRYVRKTGVKMAQMPEHDPEKIKADREKAELDRQKKLKREQQRKAAGGEAPRRKGRGQTKITGLYSDEEDEEGGESYSERRSQPRRGKGGPLDQGYGEEDEEMDDGFVVDDDEDDDGEGDKYEYSEDDIEKAEGQIEKEERKRRESKREKQDEPTQAVRRRLVVDDSDEE